MALTTILKLILKNRLETFLKDINYRTQFKHGFINKRSIQRTMLLAMDFVEIRKILTKRIHLWIYVRRLNHAIMLDQLLNLGGRGSARFHIWYSVCNNIKSYSKLVKYGEPQESIPFQFPSIY